MRGLAVFLAFVTILSSVNSSSCPCEPGTNANLGVIEARIVFLNRAIAQSKPGSFNAFLKFLQNWYNVYITKVLGAPSYGLPGSIIASPLYKNYTLDVVSCLGNTQIAVDNGTDPLSAITQFFVCDKKALQDLLQGSKAMTGGYKQTTPTVDARNKALIKNTKGQLKIVNEALENLQNDPDTALLNYLKSYREIHITLVRSARASCSCLIPCCKS